MPLRVAFVTSHPIQYQAPVFRELAQRPELDFTVFFCHLPTAVQQGAEFGVAFEWDLPLRDGYRSEVLRNVSKRPGVMEFRGCDTPEIADKLRAGGFEAVIVNGWVVKSCLQTLAACRRLRIPCLVRGEANMMRPRAWWKRLAHRQLLRRYAGCLYIGESNRQFYLSHGVPARRLFPCRYCIENERFATAAANVDRAAARQRWGIGADRTCYVSVGKFIPKKHPLELLQAFHRAVQGGAPIHLLFVGDGELRPACEKFARDHQLPVTFTGFLNQRDIVAAYVAGDCLVLPSDHGETWGLVVNEAMACGRPAIVSDLVGCGPDLIQPGETGWIFPFGNWAALADRLASAAAPGIDLSALGQAARQRIQLYSPQAAAAGIAEALAKLVSVPATRQL